MRVLALATASSSETIDRNLTLVGIVLISKLIEYLLEKYEKKTYCYP